MSLRKESQERKREREREREIVKERERERETQAAGIRRRDTFTWPGFLLLFFRRVQGTRDYSVCLCESSYFACHLAANKECSLSYDDYDFRVLARCRSKYHLNILEAMYIHVLKPGLCKQKSFVAILSVFKHAHSTHSHKLTEQSVNHVHKSTPFTHIHTTLTIDDLVFTLHCVYNRRFLFVLLSLVHVWRKGEENWFT